MDNPAGALCEFAGSGWIFLIFFGCVVGGGRRGEDVEERLLVRGGDVGPVLICLYEGMWREYWLYWDEEVWREYGERACDYQGMWRQY